MARFLILFSFLLVPWRAMPQDERYFRQIFSGELVAPTLIPDDKKYSYFIHTPYYDLDLNGDGIPEQIVFVKKDSEDWIEIFENKLGIKTKIFSYRFETKGYDSGLYRIELKKLSVNTSVLLMYYHEGVSRYTEMQATSRIYVLSIDNKDLKTLKAFKGPSFFEEHKSLKEQYIRRDYQVYLEDFNNNGTKELVVKHHLTSQVFFYEGAGKWKTFKND